MMRNANCFIILFHVNNYLHFPIETSKSNPTIMKYIGRKTYYEHLEQMLRNELRSLEVEPIQPNLWDHG